MRRRRYRKTTALQIEAIVAIRVCRAKGNAALGYDHDEIQLAHGTKGLAATLEKFKS
jgi:hypothetical protein